MRPFVSFVYGIAHFVLLCVPHMLYCQVMFTQIWSWFMLCVICTQKFVIPLILPPRAGLALLEATREINLQLCLHKQPLLLTTSGLGSFGERVVFAEIVEKEELQKIAGII